MTSPLSGKNDSKPAISWVDTLKSQNWKVILVLALVTAVCCSPIYYHRIAVPVDTDYGSHVRFTQEMLNGQGLDPLTASHPLLQLILAAMHLVTAKKLGLYASLMILQVVVQVATALILYGWFGKADRKYWDWLRAGAAFSLTFVAPIMLFAFQDGFFYYGYIGLANYHNPTIHLLKPFALLSMIYAIRALQIERSHWKDVCLSALWITISAWIKPNYAMSILPALALVIFIRWLQHKKIDWRMVIFGFAIPGFITLLIQWLIAYPFGDPAEGIIFAPFQVEGSYSGNLALKFILSILFPLCILVIARRQFLVDSTLMIGWAGFLSGALQFYLLAEGGERFYHANFRWSAQIMLFLLFAISVRWLLQKKILSGAMRIWEKIFSYGLYLAHFLAGIAYYMYCMVSIHYR